MQVQASAYSSRLLTGKWMHVLEEEGPAICARDEKTTREKIAAPYCIVRFLVSTPCCSTDIRMSDFSALIIKS